MTLSWRCTAIFLRYSLKHDSDPLFVTKRVVIFLDHILTDNVINHFFFPLLQISSLFLGSFVKLKSILVRYLFYTIEIFYRQKLWYLGKDYYIDGQNTWLIFFFLDSNWGRENGPPNSTLDVDFLDRDLL